MAGKAKRRPDIAPLPCWWTLWLAPVGPSQGRPGGSLPGFFYTLLFCLSLRSHTWCDLARDSIPPSGADVGARGVRRWCGAQDGWLTERQRESKCSVLVVSSVRERMGWVALYFVPWRRDPWEARVSNHGLRGCHTTSGGGAWESPTPFLISPTQIQEQPRPAKPPPPALLAPRCAARCTLLCSPIRYDTIATLSFEADAHVLVARQQPSHQHLAPWPPRPVIRHVDAFSAWPPANESAQRPAV